MVPLGRASLALYPEFVAGIQEISGQDVGYRTTGTLETLFSGDVQAKRVVPKPQGVVQTGNGDADVVDLENHCGPPSRITRSAAV
jgi:hypothetical protein